MNKILYLDKISSIQWRWVLFKKDEIITDVVAIIWQINSRVINKPQVREKEGIFITSLIKFS